MVKKIALAFTLALYPSLGFSADIVVNFIAIVETVDDMFCQCINPDLLRVGDTLWGFYIYDSETPDSNPSPYVGRYYHTTSPYGTMIHHKRCSFGTDSSNVSFKIVIEDLVTTYGLHDSYSIYSWNNLPDGFLRQPVELILLSLWDSTATALSSDTLPTTAPDLDDWPTS